MPLHRMLITRRHALALAVTMPAIGANAATRASAACAVFTPATQAAMTPDRALTRLKQGHERFLADRTQQCSRKRQVAGTATQQSPFAVIVGCIDSRVPPEMVFDQGIGDLFVARVAGNVINTDIIASLEFATAAAGACLIVVLGHSECGAIKGALDRVSLGSLGSLFEKMQPSIERLYYQGVPTSKDGALVQRLAEQHARDAVASLTGRSKVLAEQAERGTLKLVAAMHDVATGRMAWL